VKVSIAVNQKVGMPNYGSAGASCEITLDLAEHTVSEHPEAIVTEIRRAYALAQQSVSEQLTRTTPAAPALEPLPPPRRESDYDRLPSQARSPSAREPDRRYDRPGNGLRGEGYDTPRGEARIERGDPRSKGHDAPPRDGRQLFPWAKKQEERGLRGFISVLEDLAEREGYPRKFSDWNHQETAAAVRLWRDMLGGGGSLTGNGNGHANGNGNGNGYSR
jgi:hypothetical protein